MRMPSPRKTMAQRDREFATQVDEHEEATDGRVLRRQLSEAVRDDDIHTGGKTARFQSDRKDKPSVPGNHHSESHRPTRTDSQAAQSTTRYFYLTALTAGARGKSFMVLPSGALQAR